MLPSQLFKDDDEFAVIPDIDIFKGIFGGDSCTVLPPSPWYVVFVVLPVEDGSYSF
jgi:hypothetical protein